MTIRLISAVCYSLAINTNSLYILKHLVTILGQDLPPALVEMLHMHACKMGGGGVNISI